VLAGDAINPVASPASASFRKLRISVPPGGLRLSRQYKHTILIGGTRVSPFTQVERLCACNLRLALRDRAGSLKSPD
jgi:hypothetical protein